MTLRGGGIGSARRAAAGYCRASRRWPGGGGGTIGMYGNLPAGGPSLLELTVEERCSRIEMPIRGILRDAGLPWYGPEFNKKLYGEVPWTQEEIALVEEWAKTQGEDNA